MDHPAKIYRASAYDENLCIKVGLGLWLAILFLLRPYVVMILSLANMSDHTQLIHLVYPGDGVFALGAIAALPAVALFLAWTKRRPGAGRTARWVWHRGRMLMMLSALCNLITAVIPMLPGHSGFSFIALIQILATIGVMFYIMRSVRVRDTFQDFPGRQIAG